MTISDLVAQLVLRCGNRKGHATMLEGEITSAIIELEEGVFHPWFLLTTDNTLTTTADVETVALPSDFMAEYEDGFVWVTGSGDAKRLTKVNISDIMDSESYSGEPSYYAITGGAIHLYPTPDKAYTLRVAYYKRSGTVSDTNAWMVNASQYVGATVLVNYATSMRDKSLLQLGRAEQMRWYDKLLALHAENQVINLNAVRGE